MSDQPEVFTGLLGWSNKRTGVEFYSYPLPDSPRWFRNSRDDKYGGWGALLADEIDPRMDKEGTRVVVVVMPRASYGASDTEAAALAEKVRAVLAQPAPDALRAAARDAATVMEDAVARQMCPYMAEYAAALRAALGDESIYPVTRNPFEEA